MPISKSAKKALRVSLKKTAQNRRRKALVKAAIKNVDAKTLDQAFSAIDKAAKWGLFHPNKAARLKSRLAKQFPTKADSSKKASAKPASVKPLKKAASKAKRPVKKSAKK